MKKLKHLSLALVIALASATAYVAPTAHAGSGDNYPWKTAAFPSCPMPTNIDNWGYCKRYCTSWAAWALHDRNGYTMEWAIGDASNWGPWARAHLGQNSVNMTPAVGAIAWWDTNHVAWVKSVNSNNTVTIEEYNYGYTGLYNTRTIPKNSVSGYIHFKDITPPTPNPIPTPPPSPLVAVRAGSNIWTTDAANNAWQNISNTATAGFWTVAGDRVVVQDPNGLWVRDGVNGSWVRWGNGDSEEIQVSTSRIVVRSGSNLYANTAPNTAWTLISNTATQGFWKLTGDRVVVQDPNGLWVKDRNANFVRWGNGDSQEIQVSSSRIVVRSGSNLYANTAPNSNWTLISNTATEGLWKLASNRVVVQDPNGLWVKDGDANFVRWGNGDSQEIQVSPTRIVVRSGTNIHSNTAPNTAWTLISNTATAGFWTLSGERVALQDPNGLWVRDGDAGWVRWGNAGSDEIQAGKNE